MKAATATLFDAVAELPDVPACRFSPYPACLPSDVSWLGQIPQGWRVKRLRFAATTNPSNGDMGGLSEDDEASFVPMEALHEYGGMTLEQTRVIGSVLQGYTHFRDGDIVVAKITPCFENGKGSIAVGLLNGIGFGTTELHVVRPSAEVDRHFLFYITISDAFRKLGAAEMYGAGGQKRVPDSFIKDFRLPLPPWPEQQTIAAFLDRETARIDSLVEKKRRLIDLLREKRTALISRAVTKGLNPAAPMKPSGIPWVGEMPAHWETRRVKYVARIGNGSTPDRENVDYWWNGTRPWLNSSVVNLEEVTEASDFVTDLALRECHLPHVKPPAVLIGITGEGKTRGMATLLAFEATINQHLAFIAPKAGVSDVGYLRRLFNTIYDFLRNESDGGGSTKGAITCEQLGNLQIPHPPHPEQAAISEYIGKQTARIDQLSESVQAAMARIAEYRSALISAAVTGKIDVRACGAKSAVPVNGSHQTDDDLCTTEVQPCDT